MTILKANVGGMDMIINMKKLQNMTIIMKKNISVKITIIRTMTIRSISTSISMRINMSINMSTNTSTNMKNMNIPQLVLTVIPMI